MEIVTLIHGYLVCCEFVTIRVPSQKTTEHIKIHYAVCVSTIKHCASRASIYICHTNTDTSRAVALSSLWVADGGSRVRGREG